MRVAPSVFLARNTSVHQACDGNSLQRPGGQALWATQEFDVIEPLVLVA